ncbi:hypothetical protein ABT160_10200 [Streptomyces sp. NPDC001941]|uniref:WXG100 family type VII secretion target n=1 Tax=Streptomyces sp. NPDC001941 TaxID=3154659 RepID=UPI0033201548
MSEVKTNFDGMRAGIAAVINGWEGIDVQIKTAAQEADAIFDNWSGPTAEAWHTLEKEWERIMGIANDRLKDLDETLKKILDDQVQKEGDREQKAQQLEFKKSYA